jgi:hypothetical protein
MERGIIDSDPRHIARRIRTAMQGNVIRALVELIINSDDSYIRLDSEGLQCKGVIEVLYRKEGRSGIFAVRDYAEGMSIDEVRKSFKKYGAATSGMSEGKKVRGYFGQGAKDALAGMIDGRVCTFKGDKFVECRLFMEKGNPMYEIDDPLEASQELRSAHKVPANGTVAYFKADPNEGIRVPQVGTVQEELANNHLLRKIMMNRNRKVFLETLTKPS